MLGKERGTCQPGLGGHQGFVVAPLGLENLPGCCGKGGMGGSGATREEPEP